MDRGHDERIEAETGIEDAGPPTEPDPIVSNVSNVDAGGRPGGAPSADPSGIDDPANLNAYQGRPDIGRGADGD